MRSSLAGCRLPRWSRRRFAIAASAGFGAAAGVPAIAANDRSPPAAAPVRLPEDFGSHPETRIEWWYVTGTIATVARPARNFGFQVTFFRAATGVSGAESSRFRASQLVFAHAALTDLAGQRLLHDQRVARAGFGIAEAAVGNTAVVLRDWRLVREPGAGASRYRTRIAASGDRFVLDLAIAATQPPILQGDNGVSRKGPGASQFSRYYSEPQLDVRGRIGLDGVAPVAVAGRAWLDHEWSDSLLDPGAVGWDWIGMNLDDGSALTAFRLRRSDATSLWAGGSFRTPGGRLIDFAAGDVTFTPGRRWTSPASKASYPVEWAVATPAGRFTVQALLDAQELDALASSGAVYWEGVSRLLDASGRTVGAGYLEMTGYAARLVL